MKEGRRTMRLFDVFTTVADDLTDKIKGEPTSRSLNARFRQAVFAGHLRRARKALEGGVKPDVNLGWDSKHSDLDTFALMRATKDGDRKMIDMLLEYGADIDKRFNGFDGLNPLSFAALAGDTRMVAFLLSRGADAETAVATHRSFVGLLPHLEKEGLTDVHALLKAALDAKQEEKAKPQKPAAPSPQIQADDDVDAKPLIAPKTAAFRKTKVAVTP